MSYSILIADDNSTLRRSIRSLIELSTEWKVCGEAENGAVAIERAQTLQPDIVILDLGMPVMNGLEAARQISQMLPTAAMLMFTMHANEHLARVAEGVGIRRVVSKTEGAEDLITAITSMLGENPPPLERPAKAVEAGRAGPSNSDPPHKQQDQ